MGNVEDRPSRGAVVVVVGAGPAGLMAAIAAAEEGVEATVIEQLAKPGTRLLATGGGRCNLTNTLSVADFMARFGRHGRFMKPALDALDSASLRTFLEKLGVGTFSPDGQAVFPSTNRASDVLEAMLRRCSELGVVIRIGCKAVEISTIGNAVAAVRTGGEVICASAVILATGGTSHPELGGNDSGFQIAHQLGHRVVSPIPSLVPLIVKEDWPRRCAGVSLAAGRVWIDLPGASRAGQVGPVLFTHRGLSGPAVLNLSGDISRLLNRQASVPIRLCLTPCISAGEWRQRITNWQAGLGRRHLVTLLGEHVPASLAAEVCRMAGADPNVKAAHVSAAIRDALAGLLTEVPVTVTGTEGLASAMVTRGGVSLKDVWPETLESRLVRGLHFAGELLDLDGPCGGFNLQWAFSSGHLAGVSAARHVGSSR